MRGFAGAAAAKTLEEARSAPAPRTGAEEHARAHVAMDRTKDAEEAIGASSWNPR